MALELIEGAVEAVRDYLETNMAPKLDLLDTEYGDFSLDDIQGWQVAELTAIPEFPSVIVLGDYTEILGRGEDWLQSKHTLTIACMATDADQERLRRRLYRYIRAILELLLKAPPLAASGYIIAFERLEFSPLYARTGVFVSDSRLIAKLTKYEKY